MRTATALSDMGQVRRQRGDAAGFDAGVGPHFKHGDHRTGRDFGQFGLHAEVLKAGHERVALGVQHGGVGPDGVFIRGQRRQQVERGQGQTGVLGLFAACVLFFVPKVAEQAFRFERLGRGLGFIPRFARGRDRRGVGPARPVNLDIQHRRGLVGGLGLAFQAVGRGQGQFGPGQPHQGAAWVWAWS